MVKERGEGGDGHGLHNVVVRTVHVGDEAQYALVHGTGEKELEPWVVSPSHVGKVLVGEGLEYHGGHFGKTCLAVVTVPHLAAGPCAAELAHVGADAAHDDVAEVTGGHAAHAHREEALGERGLKGGGSVGVVACGVDAQGAHYAVVGTLPRVAVDGDGEFDGDVLSAVAR